MLIGGFGQFMAVTPGLDQFPQGVKFDTPSIFLAYIHGVAYWFDMIAVIDVEE